VRRIIAVTITLLGLLAPSAFGSDLAKEVREKPISLRDYTAKEVDFFSEVLAKVMKTAKPAFLFTKGTQGLLAVEVSLEEFKYWNLVVGKCLPGKESKLYLDENGNHHWFIGGEIKGLPLGPAFRNTFRYFRPGIAYDFGSKKFRVMVTYEFRAQE